MIVDKQAWTRRQQGRTLRSGFECDDFDKAALTRQVVEQGRTGSNDLIKRYWKGATEKGRTRRNEYKGEDVILSRDSD